MANIDDNFVEEVKIKNDIVDVISSYVELRRYNESFKGLCPFHNEKTPSFMVNERKQFFKCFGCGEGGDAISFIMKKENMDFMEALKFLADRANIPWPKDGISEEQKKNVKKREDLIRLHTDTARFYFSKLWSNTDQSLSYIKNRGLDEKIIKSFGLGYAPKDGSLYRFLSKSYTEDLLLESGIFIGEKGKLKERFFSRLIFPIFDIRGRVIAFGGRVLDHSLPKYLNSKETPIFYKKENLYGLNIAKNNSKSGILLVEGYMDVISLHQYGFPIAVASLGTALSKEQAEKLKKYSDRIYIAYDSDEAGRRATLRAIEILKQQSIYPYIIDMQDSKDPDDFIREKGTNEFQSLIDMAKPSIQFINDCTKDKYNLSVDKDQLEFIKEITSTLKNHKNAVEVEKEVIRISELTGISIKALGTEIYGDYFSPKQFKEISSINSKIPNIKREDIPIHSKDTIDKELLLLYNMVNNQEIRDKALSFLNEDDFMESRNKEIFILFSQNLIEDIVGRMEFQGNNLQYNLLSDAQLQSIMNMIKKASIKNTISLLQDKQKKLDISNPENHRKLLELGLEITELNKEIKNL